VIEGVGCHLRHLPRSKSPPLTPICPIGWLALKSGRTKTRKPSNFPVELGRPYKGGNSTPKFDGPAPVPQIAHLCDGGHISRLQNPTVSTIIDGGGHEKSHEGFNFPTDGGFNWSCGNRRGFRRCCPLARSADRCASYCRRQLGNHSRNYCSSARWPSAAKTLFLMVRATDYGEVVI